MKIKLNRTGRKIRLQNTEHDNDAFVVIKIHGYERVNALVVEGFANIPWEGIEFNRLFTKGGVLYRFNNWLGEYPYKEVELEEIGQFEEAQP